MRPDDAVRLRHMLDAARTAVRFTQQRTRTDLDHDELARHGLVRLVEIVGEAASRVTAETRAAVPMLPWSAIVGMRNRLIHGYYDVDLDVVWATLTDDLPRLIAQLEAVLQSQPE
jgi:uncharacterized protein with HEPN domain